MTIPPHAARIAGAWAVKSTAIPQPDAATRSVADAAVGAQSLGTPVRQPRRDRSHRITVSRILHPLQRHA